jgi:alpha-galactosidase
VPIHWLPVERTWILEGTRAAYACGVQPDGWLQHLYWGPRLVHPRDYPEPGSRPEHAAGGFDPGVLPDEYPAWGGVRYGDPCLKLTYADGDRDLRLEYREHRIAAGGEGLEVVLADPHPAYGLVVTLHYRLIPEEDLLLRWSEVENRGGGPVDLEVAASANWNLPPGAYELWHLAGAWGAETQVQRQPLAPGQVVLESRRGHTSHVANPFFALTPQGETGEAAGRVWFGALAWSGNWRIAVRTTGDWCQVTAGISDFDFRWRLEPGEGFATPACLGGFSSAGLGGMSRALHRYQRREVLPRAGTLRPVLYNSWEATSFDVRVDGQMDLADRAAQLGVELFVVDDGWFGSRDDDRRGLGDWQPNPRKFPQGLRPLVDHVRQRGMQFGIWVEPEMVNPDSDLYREHPDWVLHFPHRPRSEQRHQLVLNFAREDVRAHIFGLLDRLLTDQAISFVKWDHNRTWSEPGWPTAPPSRQREVWVRHVRGLYEVLDRLRARHPEVAFESCAGGGGRVDLGILSRTEQVWTSDNTDAYDRLRIQEGFTLAYAPKAMMCWVTHSPSWTSGRQLPLEFRFHAAMAGGLGIGDDIRRWTPAEMAQAAALVAQYKEIRPLVQGGDLHRLLSPRGGDTAAVAYVAEDRSAAVLFVYRHRTGPLHPYRRAHAWIRLPGLDPEALYVVDGDDLRLFHGGGLGPGRPVSGRALAEVGLSVGRLQGDYVSRLIRVRRV